MKLAKSQRGNDRNGSIVVLAAFLLVIVLIMVAFAVDVGYIGLAQTQLQASADSAALAAGGVTTQGQAAMVAVAQQFASSNKAAAQTVIVNSSDVQSGTWSTSNRTFTAVTGQNQYGNAVLVTVHNSPTLFFGKLFGLSSVSQQASAVATANPRDICFVIDLSGSMSDDTKPGSSTSSMSLMQTVYDQFGFGTYPGSSVSVNSNKTTKWIMTNQIMTVMPHAIPTPDTSSTASKSYWGNYISYAQSNWNGQLGYQSYLDFMMTYGRDVQPDGSNYTPLSLSSNLCACPMHSESVGGQSFSFPPNEMPTHAARTALIAAIQVVQNLNANISDSNQKDWVSIVTFDTAARTQQALTSNYSTAMTACTQLQACSSTVACTNTDAALTLANNLIKPQSQGGSGRETSNKIIVLLTDGQPNLQQNPTSTVNTYITNHPSSNYYGSGASYYNQKNAALVQSATLQGTNGYLYPVGVGLDCDYSFMDRMARLGATADSNGQAPRGSGDPSVYQALITQIFNKIITNPKLRLVQ